MNAFIPPSSTKRGPRRHTASEARACRVAGWALYASKFAVVGIRNRVSTSWPIPVRTSTSRCSVPLRAHADLRVRTHMPKESRATPRTPRARRSRGAAALVNRALTPPTSRRRSRRRSSREVLDPQHEHSALRITELRLEWMRGGPSPMAGFVNSRLHDALGSWSIGRREA